MKAATEFVGTFLFFFVIAMVGGRESEAVPWIIGAALIGCVYLGGHLSLAQYNPAVSIAFAMRKKQTWGETGRVIVAQLMGGSAAYALAYSILGTTPGISPTDGQPILSALLVEFVFTFMIVMVILNVAAHQKTKGNGFYGLAIGATVAAAIAVGGPISGAAFNPAVGLCAIGAEAVLAGGQLDALWLYVVGPIAGAVFATWVFGLIAPDANTEV